jgi:CheY-like chemotaxis protein
VKGGSCKEVVPDVRVLVADDDDGARALYLALLRDVAGIASFAEASDGHAAVLVARELRCQIAILDF